MRLSRIEEENKILKREQQISFGPSNG